VGDRKWWIFVVEIKKFILRLATKPLSSTGMYFFSTLFTYHPCLPVCIAAFCPRKCCVRGTLVPLCAMYVQMYAAYLVQKFETCFTVILYLSAAGIISFKLCSPPDAAT